MLIAGIGNIFLGDDGFGVEVARRLASAELPDWVQVADYGIRGMHLAYDLANGYDSAILIDTARRGGSAGTVYVIEPEPPDPAAVPPAERALLDAHGMQPDRIFDALGVLGARVGRMLIVGCEPAVLDDGIGLSAPVAAAVDEAARVVLGLVAAEEANRGRDAGDQASREGTCA